jgi:hypothetical protein
MDALGESREAQPANETNATGTNNRRMSVFMVSPRLRHNPVVCEYHYPLARRIASAGRIFQRKSGGAARDHWAREMAQSTP